MSHIFGRNFDKLLNLSIYVDPVFLWERELILLTSLLFLAWLFMCRNLVQVTGEPLRPTFPPSQFSFFRSNSITSNISQSQPLIRCVTVGPHPKLSLDMYRTGPWNRRPYEILNPKPTPALRSLLLLLGRKGFKKREGGIKDSIP